MSDRRVPLRCPSQHWGFAVNATGIHEVRCRGNYCRTANKGAVIHVFRNEDGSFVTRIAERAGGDRHKEQES